MVELKKLKADTLIETITATVITAIVFVMALTAIVNIEKMSNNHIKLKAYLLTEKIISETKQEKRYFDEDYQFETIKIIKNVRNHEDNENLKILTFKAYKNKHMFLVHKILINE